MSWLGSLLAAPIRAVGAVATVVNVVTEAAIGEDLDVFEVEANAKAMAEEIEDRA